MRKPDKSKSGAEIEYRNIPVTRLYVDSQKGIIQAGNLRTDTGVGYQRDPYDRLKWLKDKSLSFDQHLCKPLDVATESRAKDVDENTMYAIIDGGGRWIMAQLSGIKDIGCRVHFGMTRAEQAGLFDRFDSEMVRLDSVDRFIAQLGAGNDEAHAIAEAIHPYKVWKTGAHALNGVGTLRVIYRESGVRLLRRTAVIVANTWGGVTEGFEWKGYNVPGNMFAAVALALNCAPKQFNENIFRNVLNSFPPPTLLAEARVAAAGQKMSSTQLGITAAKVLAKRYNGRDKGGAKFNLEQINDSPLSDAYASRAGFTGTRKFVFGKRK